MVLLYFYVHWPESQMDLQLWRIVDQSVRPSVVNFSLKTYLLPPFFPNLLNFSTLVAQISPDKSTNPLFAIFAHGLGKEQKWPNQPIFLKTYVLPQFSSETFEILHTCSLDQTRQNGQFTKKNTIHICDFFFKFKIVFLKLV